MKNQKKLKAIVQKMIGLKESLEILLEDEERSQAKRQDAFDEKSEKWQESEKGIVAQDKIDEVSTEISNIEDGINELDSAISSLDFLEHD